MADAEISNFSEMTEEDTKLLHQLELERLYNKNQLLPRIREEFRNSKEPDFVGYMEAVEIPEKFGIDLLVQMALHKRTNLPTLIGLLRKHTDTSQECADLILKSAEANLIDWCPTTKTFLVCYDISPSVQEELDRFQFPLPMVVEPRKITDNKTDGYLSTRGSVILRNNHHDNDVCLDHLNKVNSYKLCINEDTALMIHNKWKNLDRMKEGESRQDYEKRIRAFQKYDRTAKDVISLLVQEGNEMYLTHKYDKRGRVYCQGYHVTYQGNAWNKAVVELVDQEVVK